MEYNRQKCAACDGTGDDQRHSYNMSTSCTYYNIKCSVCNGRGFIDLIINPATTCGASGSVGFATKYSETFKDQPQPSVKGHIPVKGALALGVMGMFLYAAANRNKKVIHNSPIDK